MTKYRKKPVVIEAMKWTGNNQTEIVDFITNNKWHFINETTDGKSVENLYIETLEGRMKADFGDWIIKGVKGEFYPCKPGIFDLLYDKVED